MADKTDIGSLKSRSLILGLGLTALIAVFPFICKPQSSERLPTDQEYVKELIKEFKFKYPDLVFHIYAKESGFGTSRLAIQHSNILGMKYPSQRYSTAVKATSGGWASYSSIKSCLLDYKLYELRYLQSKTRAEYMRYIRDVYSKDSNYFKIYLGY